MHRKSKKSCIVTSHDVSLNNDVYTVQFLSACRWNLPSYIDESGSVLTLDQCQRIQSQMINILCYISELSYNELSAIQLSG